MGWVYKTIRNLFLGSYRTGEPEDGAADVLRKSQLDRLDDDGKADAAFIGLR